MHESTDKDCPEETVRFIPCVYLPGSSDTLLLYFHANGEDAGEVCDMVKRVQKEFGYNVACMEYPGYGVYQDAITSVTDQKASGSKTPTGHQSSKKSDQILRDAEEVWNFFVHKHRVAPDNIIVAGRSIGSGPACHLAAKYRPKALVLLMPIKNVKSIARLLAGRLVDLVMEERFNNIGRAEAVHCPTCIIHGLEDQMVPHGDSIELLEKGFVNCRAQLFLRDHMTHNKFCYLRDVIEPLKFFFGSLNSVNLDKQPDLSRNGFSNDNDSRYFNNYQARFTTSAKQQ